MNDKDHVSKDVWFGHIKCSTHSITQQLDELRFLLNDHSVLPRLILTMNAHIFNLAYTNDELRHIMNSARMVTADGMAIVWASRLFAGKIRSRCNATEAFRAFLQDDTMPLNRGILIGCSTEEVIAAKNNIETSSRHCRLIAAFDGYQSDEYYQQQLGRFQDVDFIFIGMGTPRTEFIGALASEACPQAIVWGIGGGTIKIYADSMREAPVIFRRMGLQWLYRLLADPKALWRRYLIGNPLFLARIIKLSLHSQLGKKKI
ncbi:WecB/TagA/CpsF family glycosyltransferase [candidate division KSB1 bacterium]|nr:WecB/TagA/CpsF family glycosyltransferase [candidate division KSB1 bacterium]